MMIVSYSLSMKGVFGYTRNTPLDILETFF